MDLVCYDNPEFYDDFVFAMSSADEQAMAVLDNMGQFISSVTELVGIGTIVAATDYVGIWIAALLLAVELLLRGKGVALNYALAKEQKPLLRKRDYTSRVLYQHQYVQRKFGFRG